MRRLIIGVLIMTLFAAVMPDAKAAFVRQMPIARVQPNGDTLHCFVTGDEYYHRLHDSNDFTIVQHPQTGYYVYATLNGDEVVATNYVAGTINPATVGLRPSVMPSSEALLDMRKAWDIPAQYAVPRTKQQYANHGTLNDIVIFITFADEGPITTPFHSIDNMLNDRTPGAVSMYNYFLTASYGRLRIPTYFYPQPINDSVIAYHDIHNRDYYKPYNASSNPTGYRTSSERAEREFSLLERAVNYVNANVNIPDSIDLDYNSDGLVDNVNFIVKGTYTGWSDLLWPHKWSIYDRNVYLKGKRVYTYNLQLEGSGSHYFGASTFCHEMTHTLGAPDYYHYNSYTNVSAVGNWDLMEQNSTPPQHMCAYTKWKYCKWIDSIPTITQSGTYSLHSLGDSLNANNCYRIPTSDPYQWYVVEYRDNHELFETALPGSGLLIYRIDTRFDGNSNFDGQSSFNEIYLFRPNATNDTINGTLSQAYFNQTSGRTTFNASSNPRPMLTAYQPDSSISITNITDGGETISFTYQSLLPTVPCGNTTCRLMVVMSDSRSDGWDGASLTFRATNGHIYASLMMPNNMATDTQYVDVCDDAVEIIWNPGQASSECNFSIYDGSGALWATKNSTTFRTSQAIMAYPCGTPDVEYTIRVVSSDPVNGPAYGGGTMQAGTTTNIRVYPMPHYHLLYWREGSLDSTRYRIDNTELRRNITATGDSLFVAVIEADRVTLTVEPWDYTMGTVEGAGTYGWGDTVTLVAHPAEGYRFKNWLRYGTRVPINPLELVLEADQTISVVFEPVSVGIEEHTATPATAIAHNNAIEVRNAEGRRIDIVDILGRAIAVNQTATSNVQIFNVPASGMYIVRVEGQDAIRVIVR